MLVARLGADPCHFQLEILVLVVVVYKVDAVLSASSMAFSDQVLTFLPIP
jgi:hypothetical protein